MTNPAAHAKQHRYHSTPTQSVDSLCLAIQQAPTQPSRNLKKLVHSFKQVYRRPLYLYKRKDSPYWWYKLPAISGETRPLQGSTKTSDKKQAQAFLNKPALDRWNIAHLGVKPTYLWEEAADRWLRETSHKRTHKDDCDKIRILLPVPRRESPARYQSQSD
ncbi:MAG: hypothetical protein Q4A28_07190 [Brachymonas sp.]|nr:hypothetical protein [Brachymonas sp.]